MKIIVGLGNPGREYAGTRHNVGFMVIDELARRHSATSLRSRFRAELAEAILDGEKILLVKPQTFMNLSGVSVRETARWFKTLATDVLIVADDIELPFGTLRLRAGGGSGGHNGLKSIFAEMGTQDVPRMRIGVGRGHGDATRQVLTRFSPEETRDLPGIIREATDCVLDWERRGIVSAMNRCNRRLDIASANEAIRQPSSSSEADGGQSGHPASEARALDRRSRPTATGLAGAYNRVRSLWKKDGD